MHYPIISYEPEEPNAKETIAFDASRSLDPYGQIVDYEWDFGDKKKANKTVFDHTYRKGGTFTVMLTVTDDEDETNSSTSVIEVNEPPVAQFSYSIEETRSGYIIAFDASESYDEEDGGIASYAWNFGDNHTTEELTDSLATHFYNKSGTFKVSLTVKDGKKASGFKSIPVKINVPPIAKFSFDESEPNIGDDIAFDASQSTDTDGNITEYRWYFGDENAADGICATHNYSTYGNFTVKLEVEDDDNATASNESVIYVNKPPVASFTYAPAQPAINDRITFTSNSADDDGKITTYEWEYGDGDLASTFSEVDHAYLRARTFNVTLKVTDDKGATNSSSLELAVREKIPPVIQEFRADPEVIKSGDGVDLRWSVSDATSVVIEPKIGSVPLNGTKKVFPMESIVYTLKARTYAVGLLNVEYHEETSHSGA